MELAPYDNAITELFTFLQPLSASFVAMITDRLAVNKARREQRALDRRIRKVQKQVKSELLPGLSIGDNSLMIANKVNIEFGQQGDTKEMRVEITNQFNWELLHLPIPE